MNKRQRYDHITKLVIELEDKFFKSDSYELRQSLRPKIEELRRDAITLRKLFEHQCNGCIRDRFPNETWEGYDIAREIQMKWVDKRVATIEARIEKRCKALNLPFYIQSDPGGCSLYLGTSSDNSYNTEGVAIY